MRKCKHFEGFRIKAVSEEFLEEMKALASECITASVGMDCDRYMEGADIVLAATNSKEVNGLICETAKAMGLPVNSAHGGGDVLIPSTLRREGFVVTVSSEGRAPAFPPYVLSQIGAMLDSAYDSMLEILIDVRPGIMEHIPTQPERAEMFHRIVNDEEIWAMLRSGKKEGALKTARGIAGI